MHSHCTCELPRARAESPSKNDVERMSDDIAAQSNVACSTLPSTEKLSPKISSLYRLRAPGRYEPTAYPVPGITVVPGGQEAAWGTVHRHPVMESTQAFVVSEGFIEFNAKNWSYLITASKKKTPTTMSVSGRFQCVGVGWSSRLGLLTSAVMIFFFFSVVLAWWFYFRLLCKERSWPVGMEKRL